MKIKGMLLSLALLALIAGTASAQKFDLGIEAGANFDSFIGSDVTLSSVTSSRLGLVGGAFLDLKFGDSFAIRPEILYSQKGGKDTSNNTYQLDYIEIPVLLKLSLGTPVINPGILLGPTFNMNVAGQIVNGATTSTFPNLNQSDIGIMGGVELDIDKISLSGRYEVGLNDVSTLGGPGSHIQNGTITVLVGYSFI